MEAFGEEPPNRSHRAGQAHTTSKQEPGPAAHRQVFLNLGVTPDDLEFARQEARRSKTDIASVLISYGIIRAEDYCRQMEQTAQLPYLRGKNLQRAAAICHPSAVAHIARTGRIPASWDTTGTRYAAALPASLRAEQQEPAATAVTALTTRQRLGHQLRRTFRRHLCQEAAEGLADRTPHFSAAIRLTRGQAIFALCAVLAAGFAAYGGPHIVAWLILLLLAGFFFAVIVLRCLVLWPPGESPLNAPPALRDDELPTYSVLVPLYDEATMVPQLLDALCALDYPAALLDIKLILEEGDRETMDMVSTYRLPGCFEVIAVPPCRPQTKPKALNFALPFASGELLAIFDAEDIPAPDQLRLAAAALAADPKNLACVQARLAFYNSNQNWLTRQFALEYASLFDVTLPVLAAYGQPLPLGGTSNHFRTAILRAVGGWDAYNVTEDADLGMRFDRLGYRVDVLASTTYEEAVSSLGNWLRQRSRWLKGWMQTWLVHMRAPIETWRDMGLAGFTVFQLLLGGIVVSALVHPFFLVGVIYGVGTGSIWPSSGSAGAALLFALQAVVLVLGYAAMMLVARRACAVRKLNGLAASIPALPLYWLLVSAAAWYAVWQLLTAPFYWEKTRHGHHQGHKEDGS